MTSWMVVPAKVARTARNVSILAERTIKWCNSQK